MPCRILFDTEIVDGALDIVIVTMIDCRLCCTVRPDVILLMIPGGGAVQEGAS
jgi:hypothetical protein